MVAAGRNYEDLIAATADLASGRANLIPEIYRKWSAISMVGAAMGRRCWFDYGAYRMYPNLFVVLVGGPSSGKTVSLSVPVDHVMRGIAEPAGFGDKHWRKDWMQYGLTRPVFMMGGKITEPKLAVDLKAVQRIVPELSNFDESFFESSIYIVTTEFGTLMDKFDTELQLALTECWDNRPEYESRTKNKGQYIAKCPNVSWIACATPDEFVKYMGKSAKAQGLLSRIVLVYYDGPGPDKSLEYPSPNSEEIRAMREDLAEVAKLVGPFKIESRSLYEEINVWLKAGMAPAPADPNLKEYCGRRDGHLMKVMMAVSASRRSDKIITKDDWETAKDYLFEAEKYMPVALHRFGLSDIGMMANEIADYVRMKGSISTSALTRLMLNRVRTPAECTSLYLQMQSAGLIKVKDGRVEAPEPKRT